MRILSIQLQNLNSLRGTHEVDLAIGPLAEAGLFAITGPTGAGKSTLLDAVTLALYARAARYGNANADDMLSRGAMECHAAVTFTVPRGTYTAKWALRKTRSGKLTPAKRELSCEGTIIAEGMKEVASAIEDLTGLDYDRFLRSVLLAQGQFAAFLKCKSSERSELLEKITGSRIYSDLGSLAYTLHNEREMEITGAKARLGAVVLMTDEERTIFSSEQNRHAAELTRLNDHLATINFQRTQAQQHAKLRESIRQTSARIAEHAQQIIRFAPEATRLITHASALPFLSSLTILDERRRNLENAHHQLRTAEKSHETAIRDGSQAAAFAAAAIKESLASCTHDLRNIDIEIDESTKRLATGRSWIKNNATDATLADILPHLAELTSQVSAAQNMLTTSASDLATKRSQNTELQRKLTEIENYHNALEATRHQARQTVIQTTDTLRALWQEPWNSPEQLSAEQNLLRLRTDQLTRLHTSVLHHESKSLHLKALWKAVESAESAVPPCIAAESEAQLTLHAAREAEALLQELVVSEQRILSLGQHRAQLQPETPCPLCGAIEHPWANAEALPAISAAHRLKELQRNLKKLTITANLTATATGLAREKATAAKATLVANDYEHSRQGGTLTDEWAKMGQLEPLSSTATAAILTKMQQQLTKIDTLTGAIKLANEAALRATLASIESDNKSAIAARDLTNLRSILVDSLIAVESAGASHLAAQNTLSDHRAAAEAAFAPLGGLSEDPPTRLETLKKRDRTFRNAIVTLASLETETHQLAKHRTEVATDVKTWSERWSQFFTACETGGLSPASNIAATISGAEAEIAFKQTLERLSRSIHALDQWRITTSRIANEVMLTETQLTSELTGYPFGDIAGLRAALLEPTVAGNLKELEEHLLTVKSILSAEQEKLEQELAGLPDPVGDVTVLTFTLTALTEEIRTHHTAEGALQARFNLDNETRIRHASESAQLQAMITAARPWASLNHLIGSKDGRKFSRCAQSVTLHYLTSLANARLLHLCERYHIQRTGASDDLQLEVIDRWQADTARPVESLSGGESFLISLALALGLSELAGSRTHIGTLFIDEGFGTLDAAALDVALSALESLRTDHSTIGVISHVEALKSRISTRIEVQRTPGGWSTLSIC